MSGYLMEVEFDLDSRFEANEFDIPYDCDNQGAQVVSVRCKLSTFSDGKKRYLGALLIRDRRTESGGAPRVHTVKVIRQTGPVVDIPEGAGSLVGSFVSHAGRHTWFVFEKRGPIVPQTSPSPRAASPAPKAAAPETPRVAPQTTAPAASPSEEF